MTRKTGSGDPLGCEEYLRVVLSAPEWAAVRAGDGNPTHSAPGCGAATLAVALGRCRLFGVTLPADLDGTLTPALTGDAAQEWASRLERGTAAARRLGDDLDHCEEPLEALSLPLGLLELRMDAWAAWLAIDEGYQDVLERDEAKALTMAGLIDRILYRIREFDETLQQQAPLLAPAAETHLLDNWKKHLAAPFCLRLPWWLDGRLETLAHQAEKGDEADRFWTRIARAGRRPLPGKVRRPPVRQRLMATAKKGKARPYPAITWNWQESAGGHQANLVLPAWFEGEDVEVAVLFLDREQERASELEGAIVQLSGVTGTIKNAEACFKVADLPEELVPGLVVQPIGREAAAWQLVAQTGLTGLEDKR